MKSVRKNVWRKCLAFFMAFILVLGAVQSSLLMVMAGTDSGFITDTKLSKENGSEIISGETVESTKAFSVSYDFNAESDDLTEGSLVFEVPEGVEIVQVQNRSVQGVSGGAIELQNAEGEIDKEGEINTRAVLRLDIAEEGIPLDLVTGNIRLLCRWTETAPTGISTYRFGNKNYQLCLQDMPELFVEPAQTIPAGVLTKVELYKGISSETGEKVLDGMELSWSDGFALKYSMPSLKNVQTGIKYQLPDLPNELKIKGGGTLPLTMSGDGGAIIQFGKVYAVDGARNLSVEFITPVISGIIGGNPPDLDRIEGAWFELGVGLDRDKLPTDTGGKVTINLPGGDAINVIIKELKPKGAALTKTVSELKADHTIDWTLTYTPPAASMEDAKKPNQIVDILPEQLKYVDHSFKVAVSGASISIQPASLTISGQSIEYALPDTPNGEIVTITYTTRLTDETVKTIWNNGNPGEAKNKAEAKRDGVSISPAITATAIFHLNSKKDNLQLLSKNGAFGFTADGKRKIDWEITIKTVSRNFRYLTLIDTLGKALEVPETITVNADGVIKEYKKADHDFSVETDKTIKLPLKKDGVGGSAAQVYKITYSTIIDEKYFILDSANPYVDGDVSNKATLDFAWLSYSGTEPITFIPPEIGKGPVDTGVDRHIVQKDKSGSYHAANHTMDWKITVNPKKVNITEATLTDLLPEGLEYADSENTIKSAVETAVGDPAKVTLLKLDKITDRGKEKHQLNIQFGAIGKKSFSFVIKTKVTDPKVYQNNITTSYTNIVKLEANVQITADSNIVNVTDQDDAKHDIKSTVLKKEALTYDPVKKMVQWKIGINQNEDPVFGDTTITETLPKGLTYEEATADLKVKTKTGVTTTGSSIITTVKEKNPDGTQEVVFKLKDVKTQWDLTFWTALNVNDEQFSEKTAAIFNNKVLLNTSENVDVLTNTDFKLQNQILHKADPSKRTGNEYQYTIKLNPLNSDLTKDLADIFVKDTLDDGLYLDIKSIKLYKTSQTARFSNGQWSVEMSKAGEVSLIEDDIVYNSIENAFSVRIPDAEQSYILEYSVYIVKPNVNLTNKIELQGTKEIASKDEMNVSSSNVKYNANSGARLGLPKEKFYSLTLKKIEQGSSKLLEGAKFGLYSAKKEEAQLCTAFSGKEGMVTLAMPKSTLDTLMVTQRINTFYWKELEAPTGYVPDTEWHEITINEFNLDSPVEVKNVKATEAGILILTKVDQDAPSRVLSGAEFTLYHSKEDAQAGISPIDTKETGTDGTCTFTNLTPKTYWVKETKVPDGYRKKAPPFDIFHIVVNSGENRPAPITNEKKKGTLQITKVDSKDPAKTISGAGFTLYQKTRDVSGKSSPVTSEQFTDKNGVCVFVNLNEGVYWIKETTTPKGYRIPTALQQVIVYDEVEGHEPDADGVTSGSIKLTISNEEEEGTLKVIKVDSKDNTKTLKGAEFAVYATKEDAEKGFNQLGASMVTAQDGSCIRNLKPGTYYVKERKAPEGYEQSKDILEVLITDQREEVLTVSNVLIKQESHSTKREESELETDLVPEPEPKPDTPSKPVYPQRPEKPSMSGFKKHTDKPDIQNGSGEMLNNVVLGQNVIKRHPDPTQDKGHQSEAKNQQGQGEQGQNQQGNTETLPQAGGFFDKKLLVVFGALFIVAGLLYEKWERRKRFKKNHYSAVVLRLWHVHCRSLSAWNYNLPAESNVA